MYMLRTVECTRCEDKWVEVDDITREAFTRLVGGLIEDEQWSHAQLPGGAGLQAAAADHAPWD